MFRLFHFKPMTTKQLIKIIIAVLIVGVVAAVLQHYWIVFVAVSAAVGVRQAIKTALQYLRLSAGDYEQQGAQSLLTAKHERKKW